MGMISFGLGLVAFIYYFIGPKHVGRVDVSIVWYIFGWVAWAAGLISVLLGIESLRHEKGKSIIWPIAGLILGSLALLILIIWLSIAKLPIPSQMPIG
jgi:hypothetical protein